jgi:hypothetical protein
MRDPDRKISLRIVITAGGRQLVNVRLPIVDWSEPGLLHLRVNGKQVTVPWDDTRTVSRCLAASRVPDEQKFRVRSEIARIQRESRETLDRQLAGRTHYVIEVDCPLVNLPVKRRLREEKK